MKVIKTEEAVGTILCQDMTQILPGEYKGARFKKGHRVREEDIPVLLSMGKENLYVWSDETDLVHENDFAKAMAERAAGPGIEKSGVSEGKIELISPSDGLLKIDSERLKAVNRLGDMMIATRHGNTPVKKGDKLAGMRLIPLAAGQDRLDAFYEAAGEGPMVRVLPYHPKKVGLITTGNEVYSGTIKDGFGPVLKEKVKEYGSEVTDQVILPDDPKRLSRTIREMARDHDLVLVSGGMSVDPDDRTPLGVRESGAEIITYGSPVLPGAMMLLAYFKREDGREIPVMGLPGCVMFNKRTVFDLVLPRIMADERVSAEEIYALGEGGLCLNCEVCTYPNCGFGK